MARVIDADEFFKKINKVLINRGNGSREGGYNGAISDVCGMLLDCNATPTVDAVVVPCKIGDFVWAIRSFKGHQHPQRGIVGDMFFTKDMKLMIVVKYVARGEWGKTVFATDKEAYAAIRERK